MDRMIVDQSWLAKLGPLSGEVELCQEDGQTLGFFLPAASRSRLYDWAKMQFSREQLNAAASEEGGRSLEAILEDLEAQ